MIIIVWIACYLLILILEIIFYPRIRFVKIKIEQFYRCNPKELLGYILFLNKINIGC